MGPRYEYFKAYFARPENRKRQLECGRKGRKRQRLQIIDLLGSKCVLCGFSDIRALQLDHINGGGHKERKKFLGGSTAMYAFYAKHPNMLKKNLQILCANCNWVKAYTNKEFKPRRYK